MFIEQLDAKELDLIEKVAKEISPGSFHAQDYVLVGPEGESQDTFTKVAKTIDDANRERARDLAQTIIRMVREHGAAP